MKKLVKYIISLAFCTLVRLVKIFPNNDPIMGFALPFARKDKWWQAFLFPIVAMVSFDIITAKVGTWTFVTAVTYGTIGLAFYKYFRIKNKIKLTTYFGSGIIGVLVFDFITGPIMSSFMFKIPFAAALVGQIPFTLMHLASATAYIAIITPVVDPDVRSLLYETFAKFASAAKLVLKA